MKKLTNIFDLFLQTRIQNWVFVFGVFCSSVSFSQTVVYSENFDSGWLPTGWNNSSWVGSQWSSYTSSPCNGSRNSRIAYDLNRNSWLFTKGFTLQAGYTYYITYTGRRDGGLKVYVGTVQNSSMSTVLFTQSSNPSSCVSGNQTDNFIPSTTGTYYFGFHIGFSSYAVDIDDIQIWETAPPCTAPSTIPSGVNTSYLSSQYATVNWNPGSGDNSLVVVSPGALSSLPANGISYTGNSAYGAGSPLGNGYVVYNGPGSTVSINSLVRNTSYTVSIFSYNNVATCYNTSSATLNFTTTNGAAAFYVDDNSNLNDIYTVGSASGSDAANGKRLTPFASLTKAFTVVQAGDTVYVDAGLYSDGANKDLSLPVSDLKIIGAGMDKTLFANPGADNYFIHIDKNNTLLSNFKLTDFDAYICGSNLGQVIGISGATGVKIDNVIVDQSTQTSGGCGYPIEVRNGSGVSFTGGGVTCNVWDAGGGVRVSDPSTSVSFQSYLFYGNDQMTEDGTALRVNNGNVVIRNSRFEKNYTGSGLTGGAVYQAGGSLSIFDCLFTGNGNWTEVSQPGGTIHIASGNFTIKRSKVMNHVQLGAAGEAYGAGISVNSGGTAIVDSVYFSGNDGSLSRGTDLFNDGGTVSVTNCTFLSASNQIGNDNGGTMTVVNSGSPSASYTTGLIFINNIAPSYTANPTVPQFIGDCPTGITILPVELSSFTGKCLDGMGALTWTTDSEHNNAYFTVERSQDDHDFTTLSFVNGAINTTEKSEYHFLDTEMHKGTNYYRLSQTDLDGQTRILKTIAIENNCFGNGLEETAFVVDAVNSQVLLLMNVEHKVNFEFTLTDNMGRLLLHKDLTADPHQNKVTILLPDSMAAGVYHLTVTDGSIRVNNKVFMNK